MSQVREEVQVITYFIGCKGGGFDVSFCELGGFGRPGENRIYFLDEQERKGNGLCFCLKGKEQYSQGVCLLRTGCAILNLFLLFLSCGP